MVGASFYLDALAEKWGNELQTPARLALRLGILSINRNAGSWRFMWKPNDQTNSIALSSAAIVARMDATDALEDLYAEMQRARKQRMLDLNDAIAVVTRLLDQ